MARLEGREPIYAAAGQFVDQCLRQDGSLFTADTRIWANDALNDFHERFVGHPDTSGDPFMIKFARQLAEAPDSTLQLAAEVLYVHFLPASNVKGQRKRELINQVLGWMDREVEIPQDLDATLDTGLMNMGVAFNTGRNFGIAFLIDFVRGWKALSPADQDRLLDDPWAFKEMLFSLAMFSAQPQREALLHLIHPETFEQTVSGRHKREITSAFADRVESESVDLDARLLEIRRSLEEEAGHPINFYEREIFDRWHREEQAPPVAADGASSMPVARRAWLIRGTTKAGESLVPGWLDDGFVSIGWPAIGPIQPAARRAQIRNLLREAYPDDAPGRIGVTAGMIDRFAHEMQIGDLVVAPQRSNIFVGVITSDTQWREPSPLEAPQLARRREVEWTNPTTPVGRASVSEGLYSRMRTLLTLTDVTDFADEIASMAKISDEVATPPKAEVVASLPPADSSLEAATLLPRSWLQETIDLLDRKRQVIFYGPPGTGKTYVAQRLGDHLVAAGGNFRLVQFHPSYTYEDFFEGFRPRSTGTEGSIGFELVPGPLREIAEAAWEDPSHPYLLIIDEINRGNLAKVFGELYFLLEYRDSVVSLLYSPEIEFQIPKNLYIIGTMNTADRSIALVDTAMRRRFYFMRFSPDSDPIDSLLGRWLAKNGLDDEPARLLKTLNQRLDDPDFAIGPSYLMDLKITQPGELERVWEHALLPLLEEHFFGSEVDVAERFALASLRSRPVGSEDGSAEVSSTDGSDS